MKSCFTLYDIANTILADETQQRTGEYLFLPGVKGSDLTLRAKERGNGIQGKFEKPDQ